MLFECLLNKKWEWKNLFPLSFILYLNSIYSVFTKLLLLLLLLLLSVQLVFTFFSSNWFNWIWFFSSFLPHSLSLPLYFSIWYNLWALQYHMRADLQSWSLNAFLILNIFSLQLIILNSYRNCGKLNQLNLMLTWKTLNTHQLNEGVWALNWLNLSGSINLLTRYYLQLW